jgi:hypothetical protein
LADALIAHLKRLSVIGALGTSAVFAAYTGYLFWISRAPDEGLFSLHQFVLSFLFATWIVADTRELQRARPSFDYGWFIFLAFVIYAPYYLISTRRWRGAAMFGGMILLALLPWLAQLFVWRVSANTP